MKIKLFAGIVLLVTVIVINSCENKQAALAPSSIIVVASSCDTTNLTYSSGSNTMQAIINVQCGVTGTTSCHSQNGASGIPYTSYAGIYARYQNGQLYSVLFSPNPDGSQRMPLMTQPGWDPSCMLPKFKAWINLGCPQ